MENILPCTLLTCPLGFPWAWGIPWISNQLSHSVRSDSATPCTAAHQASLSITNSQSLLKLMSIESVMPSNHLILCHPLLLLPSIFPSISAFSIKPVLCIRWPKYWSFSFSISLSNEYSGLISFRIDFIGIVLVAANLTEGLWYVRLWPQIVHDKFRSRSSYYHSTYFNEQSLT